MLTGRPYLLKSGARTVTAQIVRLEHKINVSTLEWQPASQLELNEIGLAALHLDQSMAFDPYADNRDTGGFILIDRLSNNTVGAGMLHAAVQISANLQWQRLDVDRERRALLKQQRPCVLWLTGLSGAGFTSTR